MTHDSTEQLEDLAAERASGSQVIRLSVPPTPSEQLQLLAARLKRTPIVIMPARCETIGEWLYRYTPKAEGIRVHFFGVNSGYSV